MTDGKLKVLRDINKVLWILYVYQLHCYLFGLSSEYAFGTNL
jgi:hypothetical protein